MAPGVINGYLNLYFVSPFVIPRCVALGTEELSRFIL